MAKQQDGQGQEPRKDTPLDKAINGLKEKWENLHIGGGHAGGMLRKGAVELGQYMPAFNNAGMTTVEDPAIFPNATQGEIATARGNTKLDAEQEKPRSKDAKAAAAQPAKEAGKGATSVMGYPLEAEKPGQQHGQGQQQGMDGRQGQSRGR